MTNTGTQKIKNIVARALEIREKAGYTTERIEKRHYNMPYIPDAVKRAAKELKTTGTAPAKRKKRTVKTAGLKKRTAKINKTSAPVKPKTRTIKTKQLARKKVTVKTSVPAQAPPLKLVQQKERSMKKRFIWIKKNGKTFKQSYGMSAVDLLKKSELDKFHFVFKNSGLHGLYEALTKREVENKVEFYGKLIQELAENGKYLTGVARKRCNFDGWSFDKVEKMPAKIKPGMYGLVNIVGKDDLRPVYSGVYVDNGVLVATDAHKLIVIKDAENEAKKYNGKIIGILKNNMKQVIDGRYPAYNSVIPKMENQKEVSAFFPIDDILPAVNGAALIYKNQESGSKVQILIINGTKVGVDAEFFANLLNALKCNGSKKIKIGVTDQTRGVIIHTDNGNIGLCMPVLVNDIDNPENKFTVKPIKI